MTRNSITPAPGNQRLLVLAGLAVAVLLALAYSNAFSNDFHFDDAHVIVNNLYIRSLRNVPLFFTDAHTFSSLAYNATYRPLLTLTYAIDYAIAGRLDPRQFHLTQFVLLLILGFCLYLFFVRIFERARPDSANPFIALLGAGLFVLHVTNTETFNLISSRSDLLSTLFVVLAFLAYGREGWMRRHHFYLLPFVLGGLVKATAVVFAPLLLAYLLLVERKRLLDALRSSAPVWVVAGLMLWFLDSMTAPEWIAGGGDRIDYLRTQIWVWLRYFRLFFLLRGISETQRLDPTDPTAIRLVSLMVGEPAPDGEAMMKLARSAAAKHDAVETAIACRAALRSDPESPEARNTLGRALTNLGFEN